ncbi:VPLPA-CTERM protein sorting domain-containing protein [Armatimonadetes bacterium GBS]|jgi:hypothetical protein|nr:MAG: hypothetical protein KatS3mg021_1974 [Fimbriimonadales bacterium]CUU02100.1 VPLPA-CTERM protein sorting domain-containing protein [Armatimonadetes bacterium GBS]CUU35639.1 VPLPA-CTERM protein sorting domain-containing protein [Armatimonadetes bacterium GXS]
MQEVMKRLKGLVVRFALTSAFMLVALGAQANMSVSLRIAVDNAYGVFAIDPNTGQLVLIGQDYQFNRATTYNFSAPPGTYIYVVARDDGVAAVFLSKTIFGGGTVTVLSGVPSTDWVDWEVNTIYKPNNISFTDPNVVLNWGGDWTTPAVGALGSDFANDYPDFGTFDNARFIWAPPGGGTAVGFQGYTGAGTALFRLQVYPEPASWLALGAGLAGLAVVRRRKR